MKMLILALLTVIIGLSGLLYVTSTASNMRLKANRILAEEIASGNSVYLGLVVDPVSGDIYIRVNGNNEKIWSFPGACMPRGDYF